MKLNPDNVPENLKVLLPHAEAWGLGDDYERSDKVEKASLDERKKLIECIDEVEKELFDWLAGPESYSNDPTDEYVALTNLTLAIEYAEAVGDEKG